MFFLLQVGEDQSLPVFIQHILAAGGVKDKPASRFSRLQQQMHLRIMAQRFKMSDALHWFFNGFLVYNVSGSEFHRHLEALLDQIFQDFNLHLSHDLGVDLS